MITRGLSLRWRLVLAFLLVSSVPVLVASYIAAATIEGAFQRNIERWLDEAVRFLGSEAIEAREEAERAAAIVAAALSSRRDQGGNLSEPAQLFADLLSSVGYDAVIIYDDAGQTRFRQGRVELEEPLPDKDASAIVLARVDGQPGLAVAATRSFEVGTHRHRLVLVDVIDSKFFGLTRALESLDIHIFRLTGEDLTTQQPESVRLPRPLAVPNSVIAELAAGASSVVRSKRTSGTITAFTGLRGYNGRLVGVLACRLSGEAAGFEQLSQFELFLVLSALAGLLSLGVGLLFAKRISQPVRALTMGLRAIAAGDYRKRVPEEGGPELEELSAGYNAMAEQLERLREMEDEMRKSQQLAALGEAAAVLAHEIRNPLGIIKTSSEVVRMKSDLASSEDRLIGFVLDEVRRIDRLVQEVLDYARPRELSMEVTDLNAIVGRALEFVKAESQSRGIALVQRGGSQPTFVRGDRDRLYQMILNLVLNAFDAMPEGGTLTIEAAVASGQVLLSIQDTGTGMSDDVKARVFDPFFTTKAKGTGLGLATVQVIVQRHGGTVQFASQQGQGTRFDIKLPSAPTEGLPNATVDTHCG